MLKSFALFFAATLVACASSGGIGVAYNQHSIVRVVFAKSPAEKAGILEGDLLLNPRNLRGPVGSMCHVEWQHDSVKHVADLQRVDISKLNTFK